VVFSHTNALADLSGRGVVVGVIAIGLLGPQEQGRAQQEKTCSSLLFKRVGGGFDGFSEGGETIGVD